MGWPVNGSMDDKPDGFFDGSSILNGIVVAAGRVNGRSVIDVDDSSRTSAVAISRSGASSRGVAFRLGVSSLAVRFPGTIGRSGGGIFGSRVSASQNKSWGRR